MKIRDRIKELRRVKASELLPNPKNWRTHPKHQRDALQGLLAEVGFANALIARETPDGLMLIDGHLRAETAPDSLLPVLILDVTEAESDKLLATLDPLAALAGTDSEALTVLLHNVTSGNAAVQEMMAGILELPMDPPVYGENDPKEEWVGMPEFEHEDKTAIKTILIHFNNLNDIPSFSKLVGQTVTEKTKYIYYPKQQKTAYEHIG